MNGESDRKDAMTDAQQTKSTVCPSCGSQSAGRFCAGCGAHLRGASCTECGTRLASGARFCHGCGATTSRTGAVSQRPGPASAPARTIGAVVPRRAWGIAGLGLVAFTVFALAWAWGSSRNEGTGTVIASPVENGSPGRPPDLASMTRRERAERLYDRAMLAKESGKLDSANFFATMAIQAYGALDDRTLDDRYDLGRLALVAGKVPMARAQADTILAARPTHLLGLLLATDAARAAGDEASALASQRKMVEAAGSERQAGLPEYESHGTELNAALARPVPTGGPVRR